MWCSEPIPNSTVLPKATYDMNRIPEDVEDADTRIRIQVRMLDEKGRVTERYYVHSGRFTGPTARRSKATGATGPDPATV